VYSRVHVLLMPIKWKLQDFFVADFLSHLVEKETETELSLSHVVVVGSDRIGSDRIGSDRIGSDQHLQVGKGPVVVRRFRSRQSHHGWRADGFRTNEFTRRFSNLSINFFVYFRAIMTVSSRCHHFGTQAFFK
jgi:hypothetical protein